MIRTATSVALTALLSTAATAQVETLLCNYADIPSSLIPGPAGLRWRPNVAVAFDRPALSPNGQRWLVRGNSEDNTTTVDSFLVWGSGLTCNLIAREDDIIPTTGAVGLQTDERFGIFNANRSINDAGQFAFATPGRGTPSSENYIALRGQLDTSSPPNPVNFTVIAREGQSLSVPGYNYGVGQFADGVSMTADGRVMWISQRTPGFPVLDPREGIFIGNGTTNTLVCQTIDGTGSQPDNQLSTVEAPWRSFSIRSLIDASGNNRLVLGFMTGGNINTLALNNSVVLQQSAPLPDDPNTFVGNINATGIGLTPGVASPARWFCRGGLFGASFASVNGVTVARTDGEGTIVACGTERWSLRGGALSNIAANDLGDYVISGGTDDMTRAPGDEEGTDVAGYIRDEVLVANGRVVLLREGDTLDLDNNPATDEACVITDIETDTAVLTNDGWCYVVVRLSRPTDIPEEPIALGSALIRVRVPRFCRADLGGQGGVLGGDGLLNNNDFVVFINLFFNSSPCADFGRQGGQAGPDGQFNNNDFIVFIDNFFEGCN